MTTPTTTEPGRSIVKARQQQTWASGDYTGFPDPRQRHSSTSRLSE